MIISKKSNPESCIVCGSTILEPLISITQMPVHCNILWQTRQDALDAPKGEIELAYCKNCKHIFNLKFEPELTDYSEVYDNSLHFSPTFQNYADSLAKGLIERYDLHRKEIIEIGSGQGEFLNVLCELGGNRGTGFDPSYTFDTEFDPGSENIKFVQDFYSEKYAGYQGDFYCSRHVLEHLYEPRKFIEILANAVRPREGALVYLEVPNALFTFHNLSIWDIIYEHPSYFSQDSLAFLLNAGGFNILDLDIAYGEQFLYATAQIKNRENDYNKYGQLLFGDMDILMDSFQGKFKAKCLSWGRLIGKIVERHECLIVWGAGSKGVTFLNLFADLNAVEIVVDINPRKWGKFIPGTGQLIVPPDYLAEYQPDKIVVMNPIYKNEIQSMIEELNIRAEILIA